MKFILAFALAFSSYIVIPPMMSMSSAEACTNSYDRAADGSRCGQRASGCREGGRGGYC
jgi:hypothetical protein